jgi:hypothetical protein
MEHPSDCLCISCAPISLPTRSPIINDALAGCGDSALAQALVLFQQLDARRQNHYIVLMTCGVRVQGGMLAGGPP